MQEYMTECYYSTETATFIFTQIPDDAPLVYSVRFSAPRDFGPIDKFADGRGVLYDPKTQNMVTPSAGFFTIGREVFCRVDRRREIIVVFPLAEYNIFTGETPPTTEANGINVAPEAPVSRIVVTSTPDLSSQSDDYWQRIPGRVPRGYFAVGLYNDLLHITGGSKSNEFYSSETVTEIYSPETGKVTYGAPIPTPRARVMHAQIGQKLYVLGGYQVKVDNGPTEILNTVESYDMVLNAWTTETPMLYRRYGGGAWALNGVLYVAGGSAFASGVEMLVNTFEMYVPETKQWTTLAPMPDVLHSFTPVVCNDKLYALGGADEDDMLNRVFEYDPQTGRWSEKAAPPDGFYDAGGCADNGKIYIIEGQRESGGGSYALEFDPVANSWSVFPWINYGSYQDVKVVTEGRKAHIVRSVAADKNAYTYDVTIHDFAAGTGTAGILDIMPRSESSASYVDGKIYISGGKNENGLLKDFSNYDPVTGAMSKEPEPSYYRQQGAVIVVDGWIYYFGGYRTTTEGGLGVLSNMAEKYNPKTRERVTLRNMQRTRGSCTAVHHNGYIYVTGGRIDRTVERYNIAANTWEYIGNTTVARDYGAFGVYNNTLYCVGGNPTNSGKGTWEFADLTQDYPEWQNGGDLLANRIYAATQQVKNNLYLIGGYKVTGDGVGMSPTIEVFDMETQQSTHMVDINYNFGMMASCTDGEENIWVIGGSSMLQVPAYYPTIFKYDLRPTTPSPNLDGQITIKHGAPNPNLAVTLHKSGTRELVVTPEKVYQTINELDVPLTAHININGTGWRVL